MQQPRIAQMPLRLKPPRSRGKKRQRRRPAPAASIITPPFGQLYDDFFPFSATVTFAIPLHNTHDPREIQYTAAALCPGFVQPVLDEHNRELNDYVDKQDALQARLGICALTRNAARLKTLKKTKSTHPPSTDTRLMLNRLFKLTLTNALEELYPRITNATVSANLNSSPPDPDSIALSPSSPVNQEGSLLSMWTHPTPQTLDHSGRLHQILLIHHIPYTPRTPRATPYARAYTDDRTHPQATVFPHFHVHLNSHLFGIYEPG